LIPHPQASFIDASEIMDRTCASNEDVDLSVDVSHSDRDPNSYPMDHGNIGNGIDS